MVAVGKGYPLILAMPQSASIERQKILKAYGAELYCRSHYRLYKTGPGGPRGWDLVYPERDQALICNRPML